MSSWIRFPMSILTRFFKETTCFLFRKNGGGEDLVNGENPLTTSGPARFWLCWISKCSVERFSPYAECISVPEYLLTWIGFLWSPIHVGGTLRERTSFPLCRDHYPYSFQMMGDLVYYHLKSVNALSPFRKVLVPTPIFQLVNWKGENDPKWVVRFPPSWVVLEELITMTFFFRFFFWIGDWVVEQKGYLL